MWLNARIGGSLAVVLREILRENDNFRWFLIARALTALSLTAVAFYTIYGIRRFDMSPELVGALTSVLLVANTLTSSVIGWIGDRWGHRRVLIAANLLTVAAILIVLFAPDVGWLTVAFALTGAVNATQWSSVMTITVQFSPVAEATLLHRLGEYADRAGYDLRAHHRWLAG